MRLIDADELKKKSYRTEFAVPVVDVEDIDNAPTITPKVRKWFECINDKLLKARHGNHVLYKVDYLLDNLTREVYIMEGARIMRGKNK